MAFVFRQGSQSGPISGGALALDGLSLRGSSQHKENEGSRKRHCLLVHRAGGLCGMLARGLRLGL